MGGESSEDGEDKRLTWLTALLQVTTRADPVPLAPSRLILAIQFISFNEWMVKCRGVV